MCIYVNKASDRGTKHAVSISAHSYETSRRMVLAIRNEHPNRRRTSKRGTRRAATARKGRPGRDGSSRSSPASQTTPASTRHGGQGKRIKTRESCIIILGFHRLCSWPFSPHPPHPPLITGVVVDPASVPLRLICGWCSCHFLHRRRRTMESCRMDLHRLHRLPSLPPIMAF